MKSKNAVILFARYPALGKVKTRLAKTLGSDFAFKFYKLCVNYLIKELYSSKNNFDVRVFIAEETNNTLLEEWLPEGITVSVQKGNDLGERIINAFDEIFKSGYKKAIIVGTDIPDITNEVITNSFEKLDASDVVIGPGDDGGYYLLGTKKLYAELFQNINWSTETVLKETLSNAESSSLSTELLNVLYDIDTEEELHQWLDLTGGNTDMKNIMRELL